MHPSPSYAMLGDSLSLLSQLPDHCIDHCIVDPPYNMSKKKGLSWAFSSHVTMEEIWDRFTDDQYLEFCAKWMKEISRVVKINGNLFIFGTYHNIYTIGFLVQRMNLKINNSIIWFKPNAQPNITCRMLTESTEQMVWACNNAKEKATKWCFNYQRAKEMNGGKQLRNLWEFPLTKRSERVAKHPSQKPLSLLRRIVELGTNPGDIIIDPFAGTGTTGHAALVENRRFLMFEKVPQYIEAQKERLKTAGLDSQVTFLETTEAINIALKSFNQDYPPEMIPSAIDAEA